MHFRGRFAQAGRPHPKEVINSERFRKELDLIQEQLSFQRQSLQKLKEEKKTLNLSDYIIQKNTIRSEIKRLKKEELLSQMSLRAIGEGNDEYQYNDDEVSRVSEQSIRNSDFSGIKTITYVPIPDQEEKSLESKQPTRCITGRHLIILVGLTIMILPEDTEMIAGIQNKKNEHEKMLGIEVNDQSIMLIVIAIIAQYTILIFNYYRGFLEESLETTYHLYKHRSYPLDETEWPKLTPKQEGIAWTAASVVFLVNGTTKTIGGYYFLNKLDAPDWASIGFCIVYTGANILLGFPNILMEARKLFVPDKFEYAHNSRAFNLPTSVFFALVNASAEFIQGFTVYNGTLPFLGKYGAASAAFVSSLSDFLQFRMGLRIALNETVKKFSEGGKKELGFFILQNGSLVFLADIVRDFLLKNVSEAGNELFNLSTSDETTMNFYNALTFLIAINCTYTISTMSRPFFDKMADSLGCVAGTIKNCITSCVKSSTAKICSAFTSCFKRKKPEIPVVPENDSNHIVDIGRAHSVPYPHYSTASAQQTIPRVHSINNAALPKTKSWMNMFTDKLPLLGRRQQISYNGIDGPSV